MFSTSHCASSTLGRKLRCFPSSEPPSRPVTHSPSPGLPPDLSTTLPRSTEPVAAIEITAADPSGTRQVSPPASFAPNLPMHSPIPR